MVITLMIFYGFGLAKPIHEQTVKEENDYQLVWSDEFNQDGALNPENWQFEQGFVRNQELQWYQPDNAWCEGGLLIIEARKEQKPNPTYEAGSNRWNHKRQDIQYTSASINTRDRHSWQYGRFEIRARIDISPGLWPAFWTLGVHGQWPSNGEIDIMEYYKGKILANIACGTSKAYQAEWYSETKSVAELGGKAWAAKFHIWRMDWDEESIALYVDDLLLNKVPLSKLTNKDGSGINPFKQPHYILLNLAMGGMNGGDVTGTVFPNRYEIDYVRVYQKRKTGQASSQGITVRQEWLQYLKKVAGPVMENLAADQLKQRMTVALSPNIDNAAHRSKVAYLEAFGRTLSGIAPWLNAEGGSAEEVALRNQYRQWTLSAIANAVNPRAKDYLVWEGGQPLVDASFFALGLVRAPWIWNHLKQEVKDQVVEALLKTRNTVPGYSNWILFSSMIEAFFCKYDLPYDAVRIEYGIREFSEHWYTGDGMFSDGMSFNQDYYNSFVIQPYLQAILEIMHEKGQRYEGFRSKFNKISKRYAELQERNINVDGTYPIIGRSIVYRGGAFQHLADMALRKQLPSGLKPAQVRGALTAVMKKTTEAKSTFNEHGWLNIGVYGKQETIADVYITTGSLYLCANILLPLGLSADDPFWKSADEPWTAVKVWKGMEIPADHAMHL